MTGLYIGNSRIAIACPYRSPLVVPVLARGASEEFRERRIVAPFISRSHPCESEDLRREGGAGCIGRPTRLDPQYRRSFSLQPGVGAGCPRRVFWANCLPRQKQDYEGSPYRELSRRARLDPVRRIGVAGVLRIIFGSAFNSGRMMLEAAHAEDGGGQEGFQDVVANASRGGKAVDRSDELHARHIRDTLAADGAARSVIAASWARVAGAAQARSGVAAARPSGG